MSTIEWTDETWNPLTGCQHVSEGCDNCYAAREASGRLKHHPAYEGQAAGGKFTGEVRLHPDRLDQPLRWRKPRLVFVNSMSDLFHDDVSDEFIARVFAVMGLCYGGSGFPGRRGGERPAHTFQILTKRPARMARLLADKEFAHHVQWEVRDEVCREFDIDGGLIEWPLSNVWLGTSVENQKWADVRIPHLLNTPAAVRFLSCEPLLGPVSLGRWLPIRKVTAPMGWERQSAPSELHWVIVGGESGPNARPMHPEWARSLRDQCQAAALPFFFKQWGAWRPLEGSGAREPIPVGYWRPDLDPEVERPSRILYEADSGEHFVSGLTSGPREHMVFVGKKAAGRELAGRAWDEMPRTAEVVAS